MPKKKVPQAVLVYGNGHRVRIVNALIVNSLPGLQLDDPDALLLGERFKTFESILPFLANGIFKIESGQPCPKKCKCNR
jgi:hypothetical protein